MPFASSCLCQETPKLPHSSVNTQRTQSRTSTHCLHPLRVKPAPSWWPARTMGAGPVPMNPVPPLLHRSTLLATLRLLSGPCCPQDRGPPTQDLSTVLSLFSQSPLSYHLLREALPASHTTSEPRPCLLLKKSFIVIRYIQQNMTF